MIRDRLILVAFLCVFFGGWFLSATRSFTGTGNFNDPTKWDGGTMPTTGDNLVITANAVCTVTGNVTTSYASLSVGTGAKFDLSTYDMTVTTLSVIAGTLTIGATTNTGFVCSGLTFTTGSRGTFASSSRIANSSNFTAPNAAWMLTNPSGSYVQASNGTYTNINTGNYWNRFTLAENARITLGGAGRFTSSSSTSNTINGVIICGANIPAFGCAVGGSMQLGTFFDYTGSAAFTPSLYNPSVCVTLATITFTSTGGAAYGVSSTNVQRIVGGDFRRGNITITGQAVSTTYQFSAGPLRVKNFTITSASNPRVVIDNATTPAQLIVDGSLDLRTGAGSLSTFSTSWLRDPLGTGSITLSSASASINFRNVPSVCPVIVSCQPAARKQFASNCGTMSFTVTTGRVELFSGSTISTSGNISISAASWSGQTGTLQLLGNSNQTISLGSNTMPQLVSQKNAGFVDFTDNGTVYRIVSYGGYWRSSVSGLQRSLYTTIPGLAITTTFKDIGAGYKNAVNAKNGCTNAGNNKGIVFKDKQGP